MVKYGMGKQIHITGFVRWFYGPAPPAQPSPAAEDRGEAETRHVRVRVASKVSGVQRKTEVLGRGISTFRSLHTGNCNINPS